MEQTITNMELIIANVRKEIKVGNYQACKTLAYTYETLLGRFRRLPASHTLRSYIKTLRYQRENLDELFIKVEELTTNALGESLYKDADVLSHVGERLERASRDIGFLVSSLEKKTPVKDSIPHWEKSLVTSAEDGFGRPTNYNG